MKTLVVEASKLQQTLFSQLLTAKGSSVEVASNAEEAIGLAQDGNFDLFCISVVLPDKPGTELCVELRKTRQLKETPIVMLSSGDKTSIDECLMAGATDVYYKSDLSPFSDYVARFASSLNPHEAHAGHILYVEDSRATAAVITQLLHNEGYTLDHYMSAEEAHEAYKNTDNSYDLLISDVILKGAMNGLRLVRTIRETDADNILPILVMSGFDDATRTTELYRAGANDYVAKPPINAEFLSRVNNLVKQKRLFDELQSRNDELIQLSLVDELTGLYNRRFISEFVAKKVTTSLTNSTQLTLGILDIDHFKAVNDTYGHPVGDKVLKAIAKVLMANKQKLSIVARLGGEEFLFLIEGNPLEQAKKTCDIIREKIQQLKPDNIDVTASFGITELNTAADSSETFESMYNRADEALYSAKETGRNKVVAV